MEEQGVHAGMDLCLGHGAVVEPNEGYVEALVGRKGGQEEGLLEAVSLAEQALDAVAVYGVAQTALGYAEEHLDTRTAAAVGNEAEGGAQGKDGLRGTAGTEKGLDIAAQTEVFGFGEGEGFHVGNGCGKGMDERGDGRR